VLVNVFAMAESWGPTEAELDAKYADVDERVRWAFKLLDAEGTEPTSILQYYAPPVFGAAFGASFQPFNNYINRRPMWAALPKTVACAGLGLLGGLWLRQWRVEKNAKETAVMKHYITMHPEKFPEPERKKFGDPVVFNPWKITR